MVLGFLGLGFSEEIWCFVVLAFLFLLLMVFYEHIDTHDTVQDR